MFSQFTNSLKFEIFECCRKLDFPIFPNPWKRWEIGWIIGIFEYLSWLYFLIFTNSHRNWKLGLKNIGKEISNDQEWIKIGSLNMDFKSIQNSKFHNFRRLIMIMLMKKSPCNVFGLKGDSVWSLSLGDGNNNIFQHFQIFYTHFEFNLYEVKKPFLNSICTNLYKLFRFTLPSVKYIMHFILFLHVICNC